MSTLKVNTLEEATAGGATYFTAKAWVNFDGTGTVAIRDDGNVSSITDVSQGTYQTNFSNSLSSANYTMSCGFTDEINGVHTVCFIPSTYNTPRVYSTSACKVRMHRTDNSGYAADKYIMGLTFTL